MGDSAPILRSATGAGGPRRAAWAIVVATLLTSASSVAAQERESSSPPDAQERDVVEYLRFGYVAHDAGLDPMFRDLIEEFNVSLKRADNEQENQAQAAVRKKVRISARPRALAYVDLAKLEFLGIDVAYVTPVVFAEMSQWRSRPFVPVATMLSLPSVIPANGEFQLRSEYGWTVLVDPSVVDRGSLAHRRPHPGSGSFPKPRCGWMPLSGSGHLFPLRAMEDVAGLQRTKGHHLPDAFDEVEVRLATDMLDRFFEVSEKKRIDVAPVADRALLRYLDAAGSDKTRSARTDAARVWLQRVGGTVPAEGASPAEVAKAVERAGTWTGASGAIHNGILVLRRGLPPEFAGRVRAAIDRSGCRIERAMRDPEIRDLIRKPRKDDEYPPEVQSALKSRLRELELGGLSRTLLRELDSQDFHGIGGPPEEKALRAVAERLDWYRDSGYEATYIRPGRWISAREMIEDVARDIGHQRALEALRGERYEPRVALVLAGGGASGAYQAGVMRSLLADLRVHNDRAEVRLGFLDRVDIRIVAGTSVGALNGAVAAAAGDFDPGRAGEPSGILRDLWTKVDASMVLTTIGEGAGIDFELRAWRSGKALWVPVVVVILIAMALAFAFGLLRAAAIASVLTPKSRLRLFGLAALVAVALLVQKRSNGTIALAGATAAWILLAKRNLRRAAPLIGVGGLMLAITLGQLDASAGVLSGLATVAPTLWLGLFCWIVGMREGSRPDFWVAGFVGGLSAMEPRRRDVLGIAAVLASILALAVIPLWFQDIAAGREAPFLNRKLSETLETALTEAAGGGRSTIDAATIRTAATRTPRGGIDLVITATDLMEAGEGRIRPREICFHWGASETPRSGEPRTQWIDLRKHPDNFVDALLASAAIFPGLPPVNFPREGPTMRLIDGGYLQNVPTGPALALGATHLIVLQFEPPEFEKEAQAGREPPRPGKTWETSLDIVQMLLSRAQGSGIETVGDRRTYVNAPTHRWVGTPDFDGGRKPDGKPATLAEFEALGEDEVRNPEMETGKKKQESEAPIGFRLFRP